MILQAIVSRTGVLLPSANRIWLGPDNARTYQNEFTPVLEPFICAAYGFPLEPYLHPETARGKSLVDAHFSFKMRHVHGYVKEKQMVVATPEELVRALHYDGGISNCAAESITARRDGPNLEKCRQGVSCRHMIPLHGVW